MPAQPPFVPATTTNTPLDPLSEMAFRQWVKINNVPFNPDAGASDYDMRGYHQAAERGQPMARPTEINPNDNRPHYTDYYKTPSHQSFSGGSQWAPEGAPQWINESQLASPGGRILHDEKVQQEPGSIAELIAKMGAAR